MTVIGFVIAAGLGSATRHWVNQRGLTWRGTVAVNVVGALLLGALVGGEPARNMLTVVGVGFLGSLTTFSMFALEVAEADRRVRIAIVAITLVAGVGAATLGYAVR